MTSSNIIFSILRGSTAALLLTTNVSFAKEGPEQPWSGYKVHSMSRPKPEKVESNGALTTPAPKDAIVLFNGKNTDAFTKAWPIKDAAMVASKLGNNRTKQKFGDCQVHLEWRIPADRKVNGQGGGNSGIFLMGRYEVQILESHSNETYADGQAGSLYGQYPPLKNASTAQGEWQSYDIAFKAPRYDENGLVSPATITVIHNGVVIHNNRQFLGMSTHSQLPAYPKTHPEKAPINLQWHGDPIEFRNFWVRDLSGTQKKTK